MSANDRFAVSMTMEKLGRFMRAFLPAITVYSGFCQSNRG
jgi:hypothetical protein